MIWATHVTSFQEVWEAKPRLLIGLALGFVIVLAIVADTWWLKRRKRHPKHRHH
jgi:hypothetical protein